MDSDSLARAVADKVQALQAELVAKVEANLSGDMLQTRSGALKESIVAELAGGDDVVTATVASVGVPYAAIQEQGGTTPPHEIVPVKARALAFAGAGAGGLRFARRVHHPGSVIPARPFLGAVVDALHDEIALDLKASVLEALGAD